jgi:GWxTD domain-containing protein
MAKSIFALPILAASVFLAAGCSSLPSIRNDPFYESFYQKTRLIMLAEEIKLYRLLEDKTSKEEFIREFWRIRDPDPSTEENEAITTFEERVKYACRWFSDSITPKWKENYEPTKQDRGWQTDMGQVYIVMGPPDVVDLESGGLAEGDIDRRQISRTGGTEMWYYRNWNLFLRFERTSLGMGIASNGLLVKAMEDAKLDMISPGYRADFVRGLTFKAEYKNGAIAIRVPSTRVSFKEEGGKLLANFKIQMNIYLDHKKMDVVVTEKSLEDTEEGLAKKKFLRLEIPYPLSGEGRYLFDILMEDLYSLAHSRSRSIVETRR